MSLNLVTGRIEFQGRRRSTRNFHEESPIRQLLDERTRAKWLTAAEGDLKYAEGIPAAIDPEPLLDSKEPI
jgi:hypothetical protein